MKAACIQLRCGGDIQRNLVQAEALIRAAHADGARFIATPENTLIMQTDTEALFATIQPEAQTEAIAHYADLAKSLNIDLLIGSMAIKLSPEKAANRSFLFRRDGQIKARYDKMHMFDVQINEREQWCESANYQPGQSPVIAKLGDFTLGLSICYDLRFADLYKHYARAGANILSVPAAFTVVTGKAHWQVLLRARAIETSSYVIAPAQGGAHEGGRRTFGHSMIIDPWGQVIAEIDDDEPGYCLADLDIEYVQSVRARIPAWDQETRL